MEFILKMLTIIAWVLTIGIPGLFGLLVYLQWKYESSITKHLDTMRGVTRTYFEAVPKLSFTWFLSIVFLAVKYQWV